MQNIPCVYVLQGMVDELEAKLAAAPKASGGADDGKKDKMIKALQVNLNLNLHQTRFPTNMIVLVLVCVR